MGLTGPNVQDRLLVTTSWNDKKLAPHGIPCRPQGGTAIRVIEPLAATPASSLRERFAVGLRVTVRCVSPACPTDLMMADYLPMDSEREGVRLRRFAH